MSKLVSPFTIAGSTPLRRSPSAEIGTTRIERIGKTITQMSPRELELQQTIELLEQEKEKLQLDLTKLRQENFELQGYTPNMRGTFPPTEQIVDQYKYFGQQKMLGYFEKFDSATEIIDPLVDFLVEVVKKVQQLVEEQYSSIYSFLFPEPISDLSQHGPLADELTSHLQNNYKHIMNIEKWLTSRNLSFADQLLPPSCSPLHSLPNFASETTVLITEIHDLLWLITLTKKLECGQMAEYNAQFYNNPYSLPLPKIVLPHLVEGKILVTKGFAY